MLVPDVPPRARVGMLGPSFASTVVQGVEPYQMCFSVDHRVCLNVFYFDRVYLSCSGTVRTFTVTLTVGLFGTLVAKFPPNL